MMETYNASTTLQSAAFPQSTTEVASVVSPSHNAVTDKNWFEVSANNAYRQFNSSLHYAAKEQKNRDVFMHTSLGQPQAQPADQ